jgi:hypothetical protein
MFTRDGARGEEDSVGEDEMDRGLTIDRCREKKMPPDLSDVMVSKIEIVNILASLLDYNYF